MVIKGAEGMSPVQLSQELARGAKVVVFDYCISVVVLTFRRTSAPVLLRPGASAFGAGLPYTLLSICFGWWGIPWGFIYTPMVLVTNLGGGRDITGAVRGALPPG